MWEYFNIFVYLLVIVIDIIFQNTESCICFTIEENLQPPTFWNRVLLYSLGLLWIYDLYAPRSFLFRFKKKTKIVMDTF